MIKTVKGDGDGEDDDDDDDDEKNDDDDDNESDDDDGDDDNDNDSDVYSDISPAVPGEVSDIKAVETTNESIKLAWTPPRETGGKPVTHYVIEKMDVTSGLAAAKW